MKIFSGVKPSGDLHIGNLLGAIRQFVQLQNDNEGIFCVVDLHAITVPQEPELLRKRIFDIAATYLALGIKPERSVIFVQSQVPAHTELGWILNTMTPVGELERMTQYKDAIAKGKPNFGGLLNYPTLMAADILLYDTEGVPVGEDQVQHIELARSLAERFNNRFGKTFVVPRPILIKENARVMSLLDPAKKMSKSDDNPDSAIGLMDAPDEIRRKIKRAVTDSGNEVRYDQKEKLAISNLLGIYTGFNGKTIPEAEAEFSEKSYAEFKEAVADSVVSGLADFQRRFLELQKDPAEVLAILKDGAKKANEIANQTLKTVKEKIGFLS